MGTPTVLLYTLPNCVRCQILKSYLQEMGVEYSEVDANQHVAYLNREGFVTAPVVEIDGDLYTFDTLAELKIKLKLVLFRKGIISDL